MYPQSASDKKKLKAYIVAILLVLITVTFSGCTDKPEELQDKVNIYVYEEAGGNGDPQEQIHEFYDIALQEAGEPVITPLAQYAAELDIDPETGEVIPDTIKIYDSDGNPVDRQTAIAMQDDIVRDDAGNIITDAALLDLHIDPIGENKYQIHNLKQELKDPGGGVWRKVFKQDDPYMDEKFVDNIVGNKYAEITGGLVLGEDGNVYAIIIANQKQFDDYGGDFSVTSNSENARWVGGKKCYDTGLGLYIYVHNLSEVQRKDFVVSDDYIIEKQLDVDGVYPFADEISIAKEKGKYPHFVFEKTAS